MAYTNTNDSVTEELVNIRKNKRGDTIVVAKISDSNGSNEKYDFRQWYEDENDDLRATVKGVRLSREHTIEMIKTLLNNVDTDFLNEVYEDISAKSEN